MGALMRAHDWTATPLGPPSEWPRPLRSALGICLNSPFPMAIYWGPDFRLLCNDAWSAFLVDRHPWALGRPAREVWSDVWATVGPRFDQVAATGESFSAVNQMLALRRDGRVERTWWTYSLSPIRDDDGRVVGIFNQGSETTATVLGEGRLRFRLELEERLRDIADARGTMACAAAMLGRHLGAARAGYAEVDADGTYCVIDGSWCREGVPSVTGRHRLRGFVEAFEADFSAGNAVVVEDARTDGWIVGSPAGSAQGALGARAQVAVPLVKAGRLAALLFVHAAEARRWSAEDVALVHEVAERTWSAVERARAEARLRASEEFCRRVLASSGDCINVLDLDGRLEETSEGGRRGLGTDDAGQIIGAPWPGVFAEADRRAARRAVAAARAGETGRFEGRTESARGGPRWWDSVVTPIPGADGRPEKLLALSRDVTGARAAAAALAESEARFRSIADALPGFAWTADARGLTEWMSPRWAEISGLDPAANGEGWVSLLHPDDVSATRSAWATSIGTGKTFDVEFRLRAPGGGYRRWLARAQPARDRSGVVERWVGVCTDVTRLRHAEAALLDSKRRLKVTHDNAGVGIQEVDAEGRYLGVNETFTKMSGYALSDLQGRSFLDFIADEAERRRAREDYAALVRGEVESAVAERRYTNKSGQEWWAEVRTTAVRDEAGRFLYAVRAIQDVTERRTAAERQALLAREVDHRAKNVLAVVQATLRLTRAADLPSFVKAVEGRVGALARAQTLLAKERWSGADLRELLRGELAAFPGGTERATAEGPDVALPVGVAQPLSMAVHELATNAVKHGALSAAAGRVGVSWGLDAAGGTLRLRWAETGGSALAGPPERRGFGSRVLERTVGNQLGGEVSLAWEPSGLVCTMAVPLHHAKAGG